MQNRKVRSATPQQYRGRCSMKQSNPWIGREQRGCAVGNRSPRNILIDLPLFLAGLGPGILGLTCAYQAHPTLVTQRVDEGHVADY